MPSNFKLAIDLECKCGATKTVNFEDPRKIFHYPIKDLMEPWFFNNHEMICLDCSVKDSLTHQIIQQKLPKKFAMEALESAYETMQKKQTTDITDKIENTEQ